MSQQLSTYTVAGEETLAELTPEGCGLDYWHREVMRDRVLHEVNGHAQDATIPSYLIEDTPLRHSLIAEFSFQAIAEEKATRSLSALIDTAPDPACLDFYCTQLMDEARHGAMYRGHLLELGVQQADLASTIEAYARAAADLVLTPVQTFGLEVMAEHRDFHRGVVLLTVLVEGVIAPITELSEQRWRPLHPAAAQLQRSANTDEMRHLSVGSSIVRRHLTDNPERTTPLRELVDAGRKLWDSLPMRDVQLLLERLYQEGLEQQAELVGDYEIWPGRRLLDTTPEERVDTAARWAKQIQDERIEFMLLDEAYLLDEA